MPDTNKLFWSSLWFSLIIIIFFSFEYFSFTDISNVSSKTNFQSSNWISYLIILLHSFEFFQSIKWTIINRQILKNIVSKIDLQIIVRNRSPRSSNVTFCDLSKWWTWNASLRQKKFVRIACVILLSSLVLFSFISRAGIDIPSTNEIALLILVDLNSSLLFLIPSLVEFCFGKHRNHWTRATQRANPLCVHARVYICNESSFAESRKRRHGFKGE